MTPPTPPLWTRTSAEALASLGSSMAGLSEEEAAQRLARSGPNVLGGTRRFVVLRLIWAQLGNPLVLILLFAAVVSSVAREWTDSIVVMAIVIVSSVIGFWREFSADRAVEQLKARMVAQSRVRRGGVERLVPSTSLVTGDVVLLNAGSLVPADSLILEARDFFVSEAVLTGETYPREKTTHPTDADAPLASRDNVVFLGTNVRSGIATAVVMATGGHTELGHISGALRARAPETEFDAGLRHFGGLLTRVMLVMTLLVLSLNLLLHRPPIESLLFAIALAVGLTPELLPAILSVNLARSAAAMVKEGVVVRRLNAIENFGSMDVLCTDKTGTLTEGDVKLAGAVDVDGQPSTGVLASAFINASLQSGVSNPLDEAIVAAGGGTPLPHKLDEVPYDFSRKRLSVVVEDGTQARLITKGAFASMLEVCDGIDDARRASLEKFVETRGNEGFRVLAIASRRCERQARWARDDERGLTLDGFLLFADPPKPGIAETLKSLERLGVTTKIITGDNRFVAAHVARQVGLGGADLRVITGATLDATTPDALGPLADETHVFAEVDPRQKERVLLALKKRGHVVGYLGDGINDAPALHAADVGISVDTAVDVAREAADLVLLKRDLEVLQKGILSGRRTFANTLKYILTTTSANLGNMLSMAIASLVLPFFPLLAGQILLNNFLSDIPAFGLATDDVDEEWLNVPHRWDQPFLRRFMVRFGLVSSAFDLLTFAVLLLVFRTTPEAFRTGWFIESLLTEVVVALVVRTQRPVLKSRPGKLLLWTSVGVAAICFAVPFIPRASVLGFVPVPVTMLLTLAAIAAAYVMTAEALKRRLFPALLSTRGVAATS
jgi:Mg2+-importing ATPase